MSLLLLKLASLALCAAALALGAWLAAQPGTRAERSWQSYLAHLERALRGLFVALPVKALALGQLGLVTLLALLALALRSFGLAALVALAVLGPALLVRWLARVRVQRIEASLDTFVLSLSNALRTTPSIGSALGHVQQLTEPPLSQELALALREMRLGTSVDQALLNMAERIDSVKLDATLSGLLIARQVGGDVAQTLATTAQSLREMGRLEGVVRTKTAAGRAQLWLLALFPGAIVLAFDTVRPDYFAPLAGSLAGALVVAASIGLWAISLLIARKVLAVDL